MHVFRSKNDLTDYINNFRKQQHHIGFVPTMGYLHAGHGSLIIQSKKDNTITVCSIFVNPLQFNEQEDFLNYPRNTEQDIQYLTELQCDVLYIPDVTDIYPEGHKSLTYNFGYLEQVMEGFYRPGHFQGVAEVVRILFTIVQPHRAYFGEKDYQQLLIIQELVKQLNLNIQIIACPIVRESDGLAMSSRNARLTPEERQQAPFIFQQLMYAQQHYKKFTPDELRHQIYHNFAQNPNFQLEYFEIADSITLQPVDNWDKHQSVRAFIAARLGKVRLIDNVQLF